MPVSIPQETLESFSDFLGSKGLRMRPAKGRL